MAQIPSPSMPQPDDESPQTAEDFPFPPVCISRAGNDDITVEIELCLGDITNTPSRVILLGQMRGLDPTSAAADLNNAMEGNLFRLLEQRNAARGAGSLDIIPTGRFPVMADLIAFLGLGNWEDFTGNTLIAASRSALRNLLASSFDEFSTTLMGGRRPGASEIDVEAALLPMMIGFIEALRDDPQRDRFRRIVIVERDGKRLLKIHDLLRDFVKLDDTFKGIRTTLRGSRLRFRQMPDVAVRVPARNVQSNLLNLSMTPVGDTDLQLVAMLQPAWDPTGLRGGGATVERRKVVFGKSAIAVLYETAGVDTAAGVATMAQLARVADQVGALLPPEIGAPLDLFPPDFQSEPRLEIIHDAEASRVPWEALRLKDGRAVALFGGISRRFISESTRSLWPPRPGPRLRMLMIVDPTDTLKRAREEGEKLRASLAGLVDIEFLTGDEATFARVDKRLNDSPFDVLHFAGHAGFNRQDPRLSGLRLADGYFTARSALALKRLPAALIFNCCEMARIERLDPVIAPADDASQKIIANRDQAHGAISLAEAFLIAGVHHYIGTFWPVNDDAATLFGTTLHAALARREPVGAAVTAARRALNANNMPDWANYIHYGDPDATLQPGPFSTP